MTPNQLTQVTDYLETTFDELTGDGDAHPDLVDGLGEVLVMLRRLKED